MSADLEKKVADLKVDEKDMPKPHPNPESIYESFTPQLKEYFESLDGRVKLIHETFNQIAITNGKPPPPPSFISFLLDITDDQIKNAGPEGPVISFDQFLGGIKKTIFENETKEDFEAKFMSQIKAATGRMNHAKKLMKEIREDLTKFHEKVAGDSDKLFEWFKEMIPAEVKVPLEDFIFGLEANLDEGDSADKIRAVCAKF